MNPDIDPAEAARRVVSAEAWGSFCDMLKMAGTSVLRREGTPDDAFTRAEGIRYLTRITRAALQTFIEHADPLAPVLQRVVHETAKMGADNPDNFYQNAAITGAERYRVHGTRGTVQWLELATQVGHYGEGGGMPPSGRIGGADLALDAGGWFEVLVSVEPPADRGRWPNWLPMSPESGTLIVRQSRLDPSSETLAELHIERIGPDDAPIAGGGAETTAVAVEKGLRSAAMLVGGAAHLFAGWAEGFTQHVNTLPRFDPELSTSMGGVPDIAYYHSYWRLGPDECLVVEFEPPPCDHWNFQLNNHWMESLDYRYHRIHTNSALATPRPDGAFRLVVAHRDPGVPNWLTTVGHGFGTMCFRWVRPEVEPPPEPRCRVVAIDALQGTV